MEKQHTSDTDGEIRVEKRTAQINGIRLYYEIHGTGSPLLLLHGFGGSSRHWHPFIPALSERFQVIAVDLRGHGHSTGTSEPFTHRQAAHDVTGLLDLLGISKCSAMGISSGGMTLLHIATSEPQRIESLVLISTTTHFPPQARAIMRSTSFECMPEFVRNIYNECATRGEEQVRDLLSQFRALHDNHDDMNFSAGELQKITARTLILHGDSDQFFPAEIAETMHRAIPGSALRIYPGAGHVALDDPALPFSEAAYPFLMP
jgi:pimeloyl-ACP methyl ester carboxylesterase